MPPGHVPTLESEPRHHINIVVVALPPVSHVIQRLRDVMPAVISAELVLSLEKEAICHAYGGVVVCLH